MKKKKLQILIILKEQMLLDKMKQLIKFVEAVNKELGLGNKINQLTILGIRSYR